WLQTCPRRCAALSLSSLWSAWSRCSPQRLIRPSPSCLLSARSCSARC
ncbi:hypothetical protein HaLaN_15495, partial [Haematococcus lacustris]